MLHGGLGHGHRTASGLKLCTQCKESDTLVILRAIKQKEGTLGFPVLNHLARDTADLNRMQDRVFPAERGCIQMQFCKQFLKHVLFGGRVCHECYGGTEQHT